MASGPSEFGIIEQYFRRPTVRDDVLLGVGDDCALVQPPPGQALAMTIDTSVAGRHFPEQTAPRAIGHKVLAVSISDLAAMGAEPAWATLSLSLPEAEPRWLEAFAAGLWELADRFGVALVGGDTVRGPLVITTQLHGFVPEALALRRGGARPGDRIFVTGTLGGAARALELLQGGIEPAAALRRQLDLPEPRIEAGVGLRGIATAAIDLSDGLAADLGHILKASAAGATIDAAQLPIAEGVRNGIAEEHAVELALGGGDDYELCFTVPPGWDDTFADLGVPVSCIGVIEQEPGLRVRTASGIAEWGRGGWDHFG